MIAQRTHSIGGRQVRFRGERDLNGGASYVIDRCVNAVSVVFFGMNDYCAERVRNEIAELVHRYFAETQRKPGGIRTFRRAYREERASLMPEIKCKEGAVSLNFSDHSSLVFDHSSLMFGGDCVYVSVPQLNGFPEERRPYKGFTYKAERFYETHDEETLRAALERWGEKAS
jgi:hypothetical protein